MALAALSGCAATTPNDKARQFLLAQADCLGEHQDEIVAGTPVDELCQDDPSDLSEVARRLVERETRDAFNQLASQMLEDMATVEPGPEASPLSTNATAQVFPEAAARIGEAR